MIIEIFAGTSRVTCCLKQYGLASCFGVDHVRSKQCASQVVIADLCTPEGIALLKQWLAHEYVVGIFLAPPCGSASRARQIPLGKRHKRKHKNHSGPRPLRDDNHPNGLPNLSMLENVRLSRANKLYHLTSQLALWAINEGCLFCVENPQFSLFWATTFWTSVAAKFSYTIFHSCQYGSARKKKTMLAHNHPAFRAICAKCPGQNSKHKHLPWGVNPRTKRFATTEETAYPMGLAKMIANCYVVALRTAGVQMPPQSLLEVDDLSLDYLRRLRATAGMQPKASRMPPLVPTFKKKLVAKPTKQTVGFRLYQKIVQQLHESLPKGSKLLAIAPLDSSPMGGVDEAVVPDEGDTGLDVDHGRNIIHTWGIPWTPLEFVEQAAKAKHPMQLDQFLPNRLRSVVTRYSETTVQQRVVSRTSRLGFWVGRAKDLAAQEEKFHSSLHPHVASVLKGKRLLLMREMMQSIQYEDMDVFEEFTQGTMLVGSSPISGLWPLKFSPATMTLADLDASACKERDILGRGKPVGDHDEELAQSVWQQTMDETKTGALVGPLDLESVPCNTPLSRRFGIRQGGKIRCVDDFSRSGVNACCCTSESPKPHTVDVIAALCMSLATLSSSRQWLARSFDLKQAYRQCAVHPASEQYAHIIVYCPSTKKNMVFVMRALPFGSVRSVHSFLRLSSCLVAIAASEFSIPVTSYFDDFITVCEKEEVHSVSGCMAGLFKLLGWKFAEHGDKAQPFAETVAALGVSVNVSNMHQGLVTIDNTAGRKNDIAAYIDEVIKTGSLSKMDALRLRGRMQFAAGQIFGRLAKKVLAVITGHAYGSHSSRVSPEVVSSLALYRDLLKVDVPRELRVGSGKSFILFTDASFEPDHPEWQAGLGGVLCTSDGAIVQFFSVHMPPQLREKLNVSKKKKIIFELEFFTIWCALHVWKDFLLDAQAMIYTDNDGVRDCLIACQTDSANGRPILNACLRSEFDLRGNFWYARVPTDSNIADEPSRNDVRFLMSVKAERVEVDLQVCFDAMVSYNDVGEARPASNAPVSKSVSMSGQA